MTENEIIKSKLSAIGIEVESVYDLINSDIDYTDSIDTLISLLDNEDINDKNNIEGIVRALSIESAKGKVEEALLKKYNKLSKQEKKGLLGWSFGNAIEYFYNGKNIELDKILNIVNDNSNGISRQMFVLALGKSKNNKETVENVLIKLTHDEDVTLHAIAALSKLKSIKAIDRMKELTDHPNKVISKKAKNFLDKMIDVSK